jgi:hypothetical protein
MDRNIRKRVRRNFLMENWMGVGEVRATFSLYLTHTTIKIIKNSSCIFLGTNKLGKVE